MPYGNQKLEWKIGEPGAAEVCEKNLRLMDMVFARLVKQCGNPDCRFPISALREENFAAPEYGEICATCKDLYGAITMMNPKLKNTNYFRFYHAEWEKQNKDAIEEAKKRRRRLGMDEDYNGHT